MCPTVIRIPAKISSFACAFVIMTGIPTVDAGPLNTPRSAPTVTKLQNGKVLVVGGADTDVLASAEIFDPATNNFTPAGSLNAVRHGHTATLLNDGRVLIAGGRSGSPTFQFVLSIELYNPASGTFTTAGNLVKPRDGHTATLLDNGKVLLAGGNQRPRSQNSAEIFDPATGTSSATGDMTIDRSGHAAVKLNNGNVFVSGGLGGPDGVSTGRKTEQYNPTTSTWSALGDMNSARVDHTAVLLSSGKVYLAGETNSELFDPTNGSFTLVPGRLPPSDSVRRGHSAVRLPAGDVLIFGGAAHVHDEGWDETQFRYLESSNSYRSLRPGVADPNRDGCPAVLLDNGLVLIVGGGTGTINALGTAILYDPSNDTFSIP